MIDIHIRIGGGKRNADRSLKRLFKRPSKSPDQKRSGWQSWQRRLRQQPIIAGLVAGFLVISVFLSLGAVTNLLLDNSILRSPENSFAAVQANITHEDIDELEATDGSGLDELTTAGSAEYGSVVTFKHTGSGTPTEGVLCSYLLQEGTATQTLPQIVLPHDYDASTNAVYWEMVGFPKVVGGTYLLQNLESGKRDEYYRIGARNATGTSTLEVGNSPITLND